MTGTVQTPNILVLKLSFVITVHPRRDQNRHQGQQGLRIGDARGGSQCILVLVVSLTQLDLVWKVVSWGLMYGIKFIEAAGCV